MEFSLSPAEIIEIVQASSSRGTTTEIVHGIASLQTAHVPATSPSLGNPKYKPEVGRHRRVHRAAPARLRTGDPKPNQLFLLLEKPSIGLARLCARLEQCSGPNPTPGIHPSAIIAPDAQIAGLRHHRTSLHH
jgi:UDP-3-O-[3-hydroxymyristoyl] glucosamine N-acyltransferase